MKHTTNISSLSGAEQVVVRALLKNARRPSRMVSEEGVLKRVFWKISKKTQCWLWIGASTGRMGHCQFWYGKEGKSIAAHRAVLKATGVKIPPKMTVDHLCRVPSCVNPSHLEVVTNRENILRGTGPSAINSRKTHCSRGHELSPRGKKHRECKICRKITYKLRCQRRKIRNGVNRT